MKKLFIACILILVSIPSFANDTFKPFILKGKDLPVCNLALKHYQTIYDSADNNTKNISNSRDIYVPELKAIEIPRAQGTLETATIEIDGQPKTIAFYSREIGWRGLTYTGYMINADELENLKSQINESDEKETIKHFYPMGELAYGSNFSWWLNVPFEYQGHWYVLGDFGDFTRHNAIRNVYKIKADSSSLQICSLQIFKNYEPQKSNENLPYFAAYINSVETILLSRGDCGTSNPEARAKSNGQFFVSSALTRPWSISNPSKTQYQNSSILEKQLHKHFDHWKFTDIWTYREYDSFTHLQSDAEKELTEYYVSALGYTHQNAEKLAKKVMSYIPYSYYSLGEYHDSEKDFTPFQKMVAGNFNEWQNIDSIMSLHYEKVGETSFTLMLDNPEQFKNIPDTIKIDSIQTAFKKNLLMYAAHMNNYDTVEWLINSGFPINRTTQFKNDMCAQFPERTNRSALTYAVENGSIYLIKLLIEAGEKTDIIDTKGNHLNFYLNLNSRFTKEEKQLGLNKILEKYKNVEIKPGFSCSGNLGKVESAICNSKGLSIYDSELGNIYKSIASDGTIKDSLKKSQISWLRQRTKECVNSKTEKELNGCIARSTRSRIRYLEHLKNNVTNNVATQ